MCSVYGAYNYSEKVPDNYLLGLVPLRFGMNLVRLILSATRCRFLFNALEENLMSCLDFRLQIRRTWGSLCGFVQLVQPLISFDDSRLSVGCSHIHYLAS